MPSTAPASAPRAAGQHARPARSPPAKTRRAQRRGEPAVVRAAGSSTARGAAAGPGRARRCCRPSRPPPRAGRRRRRSPRAAPRHAHARRSPRPPPGPRRAGRRSRPRSRASGTSTTSSIRSRCANTISPMPPASAVGERGPGRVARGAPAPARATRAATARPPPAPPTMRTAGARALTATAMAAISPPPPTGHHDRADVRQLLEDLQADRALAGGGERILEGVDVARRPSASACGQRRRVGVVVGRARARAPHRERAQLLHLGARRGLGHEQRGAHAAAQRLGREGDAQRVVAGGGGHHAARALPRVSDASRFERAAHLERAGRLPALELQQRVVAPRSAKERRSGVGGRCGAR